MGRPAGLAASLAGARAGRGLRRWVIGAGQYGGGILIGGRGGWGGETGGSLGGCGVGRRLPRIGKGVTGRFIGGCGVGRLIGIGKFIGGCGPTGPVRILPPVGQRIQPIGVGIIGSRSVGGRGAPGIGSSIGGAGPTGPVRILPPDGGEGRGNGGNLIGGAGPTGPVRILPPDGGEG